MNFQLRGFRQACRDRQREIAARIALVDKLGRRPRENTLEHRGEDFTAQLSPWEAIFARPEWVQAPESHDGRCSCCGAAVSLDKVICDICGAGWKNVVNNKKKLCAFCVLSIGIALTIGGLLGRAVSSIVEKHYLGNTNVVTVNSEFISFIESYVFVTGIFISLLVATYVFEKMNLAPKGAWEPFKSVGRESTTHDGIAIPDRRN
jgi:hypothetical protein